MNNLQRTIINMAAQNENTLNRLRNGSQQFRNFMSDGCGGRLNEEEARTLMNLLRN